MLITPTFSRKEYCLISPSVDLIFSLFGKDFFNSYFSYHSHIFILEWIEMNLDKSWDFLLKVHEWDEETSNMYVLKSFKQQL